MKRRFVGFIGVLLAGFAAHAQPSPREQAMRFIKNETQFHLGYLPTEQSHPKTRGLSQALQKDTAQGLRMLLSVDDDLPPVATQAIASEAFAQNAGDDDRAACGGYGL